jgi:hypothetical protein
MAGWRGVFEILDFKNEAFAIGIINAQWQMAGGKGKQQKANRRPTSAG